jgi:hypothetical protein
MHQKRLAEKAANEGEKMKLKHRRAVAKKGEPFINLF